MRKEEFYFDSKDTVSRIYAVRYMPDTGNVSGIVQIMHGMAEYVERYEAFAGYLTDRGFVVTGEDHLGHGKSVGETGTQGYFCAGDSAWVVVDDNHSLRELTQKLYPGVPYYILGHSMGSFILRNYLNCYSEGIHGVIIMGTGSQPGWLLQISKAVAAVQRLFLGEKHVSHFLDKAAFGAYNKRIESPKTKFDWLSRDQKKVAQYIADPDCGFVFTVNGFRTLFELIRRCQSTEAFNRIPGQLPILVVSGQEDPVGGYGKGTEQVAERLRGAGLQDVTLKLYPGCRHELLNEIEREQIMEDIYCWLLEKKKAE
ncbi:MAG: alpha/beta hydrolase [Lachnospiraceae bacterium]|nr:alpha/beta hydrolase [Lachnospiraceae bacterium]